MNVQVPSREKKIWGHRTPIYTEDTVESYLLELLPVDKKPVCCSTHHHTMKYNRFFVISGKLIVRLERETIVLMPGEAYTVSPMVVHSFEVTGPALVVETTWATKITEDIIRQNEGHVLDA